MAKRPYTLIELGYALICFRGAAGDDRSRIYFTSQAWAGITRGSLYRLRMVMRMVHAPCLLHGVIPTGEYSYRRTFVFDVAGRPTRLLLFQMINTLVPSNR